MISKIRPALLSLCLIGFAAAPALADNNWDRDWRRNHYPAPRVVAPPPYVAYAPVLNEFQVRRTLRIHGFSAVHDVELGRGGVYHARARDNWGRPVVLTVGAYDGRVLNVRPAWH